MPGSSPFTLQSMLPRGGDNTCSVKPTPPPAAIPPLRQRMKEGLCKRLGAPAAPIAQKQLAARR